MAYWDTSLVLNKANKVKLNLYVWIRQEKDNFISASLGYQYSAFLFDIAKMEKLQFKVSLKFSLEIKHN